MKATAFAIQQPDGTWTPCDSELNAFLSRALEQRAGMPGAVTVRDDAGEAHTLSHEAGLVLSLALLALDARLRPGGCYRERADELYAGLARGHAEGLAELRRVFQLGAKRPWLVP